MDCGIAKDIFFPVSECDFDCNCDMSSCLYDVSWLLIGYLSVCFSDVKVFAKKEIPLRTKFGPVEGDVQPLIDPDHVMKKHSALPLYLIDESTYIDTTNERKSDR